MSGVQLSRVTKSFGAINVIPTMDLSCDEGEFVVIVGPSGCGKSTTLRMIAGLEEVSSGSVFIAGKDVTKAAPKERDIAMVLGPGRKGRCRALPPPVAVGMRIAAHPPHRSGRGR